MKMEARKMALDKVYKRRNRYDIPEWQRDEVWTIERKQQLIDSILKGWKLPKFYFAKTSDNPEEYEVVDGQQRLTAIFEFYDGELELTEKSVKVYGARFHAELPDTISDHFDDFEIEYDEISEATDEELQDFFQRLQGGMQLTAPEKLNAVASNLTKFARDLAKHQFFTSSVAIKNTRKAYFDIASKAAAIEVEGLDVGLRFDDLKATFESQHKFSTRSKVADRLTSTLDYLAKAIPKPSKSLRNRSTIQSFITLAARIIESGRSSGTETNFRAFVEHFGSELAHQVELGQKATDKDYLEFQRTLSANVKTGPKTRSTILLRKLLIFDPSWADILGAAAIVASQIQADIEQISEEIVNLVRTRNEEYAAIHGHDLFKATNKTASAQTRMRKHVTDFNGYKQLIDDLYFLFREGPGTRLEGNVPPSFEDINLLRTGLQHDVDHGKSSAVSSKKRKIGAAFKKYAGDSSTPETLSPERFPIVQAALLKAVANDLAGMTFEQES